MNVKNLLALALMASIPMGLAAQVVELKKVDNTTQDTQKSIVFTADDNLPLKKVQLPVTVAENSGKLQSPKATAETTTYTLRATEDDYIYGLGFSSTATIRAGIVVNYEQIQMLTGGQLVAIGYGIGSGMSDLTVFVSESETGDFVTSQTGTTTSGWNEVTLDTPYTLTGEQFYIGYEATVAAGEYPIGVSYYDTGWDSSFCYQLYYGSYYELSWSSSYGGLQVYGLVEYEGEITTIELTVTGLGVSTFAKSGEAATGTLYFTNAGLTSVTGLTLTIESEEGTETLQVNGTVQPSNSYYITIDELGPFTATDDIEYRNITVTLNALDETLVEANPDDNSASGKIIIYNDGTQFSEERGILLEKFTTEMCPYCPTGETYIQNVLPSYSNYNIIRADHHAAYYYDAYTIDYSSDMYPFFYNSYSSFAPGVMVGRTFYISNGYEGLVFYPSSTALVEAFDDQLSWPNFVTMNLETTYDEDNNKLNIKVTGQNKYTLADNLVMNVFITEDGITTTGQSGYTGTWTHNQTLREVLTGYYGSSFTQDADGNYEFETAWDIKTSISGTYSYYYGSTPVDLDNVNVVAFISNMNTSDVFDCHVFNAVKASDDLFTAGSGIGEVASQVEDIKVFGLDGNIVILGSFDKAEIYTVDGKLVDMLKNSEGTAQSNGHAKGVYVVKTQKGSDAKASKVVIK